jgi:hypothetical protein
MDPNENMERQRFYAANILRRADAGDFGTDFRQDAEALAELVQALDDWRSKGGFDPYSGRT